MSLHILYYFNRVVLLKLLELSKSLRKDIDNNGQSIDLRVLDLSDRNKDIKKQ